MPPVTALHRPGTPHRGSSTFAADSAATRCTPVPGPAPAGRPRRARRRGVQEQGGNALQPGADRFGVGEVGGYRLHTLGQAGGPGAADDGTDFGALVDQDVDQGTSDGTAAPVTRITPRPPICMGA